MSAPIAETHTIVTFSGTITVAELSAVLEGMPPAASVRFTHHQGDQRDPSYMTMTITHGTSRVTG